MARRLSPRQITDSEHADSGRDMDSRVIYPGVAGRDPLGDHKSAPRSTLYASQFAGNSRLASRSYPNPRYGLRKHRTR